MFDSNLPTRFIEIDSHKIAYYRTGEGPPMVLLHGITTSSFIWRRLIPALGQDFDVIAIDLLGCGDSDKPAGVDYSILAQARLIRRLLAGLALEKAHFVTHDIGGGIGQIMAVNRIVENSPGDTLEGKLIPLCTCFPAARIMQP